VTKVMYAPGCICGKARDGAMFVHTTAPVCVCGFRFEAAMAKCAPSPW
jgi:hypothetical protein